MKNNSSKPLAKNPTLASIRQTYINYEENNKEIRQVEKIIKKEHSAIQSEHLLNLKYQEWIHSTSIPNEIAIIMHPQKITQLFCIHKKKITPIGNKHPLSTPAILWKYIADLFFQTTNRELPDNSYLNSTFNEFYNALYDYLKSHPLPRYLEFLQSYVNQFYIHSLFYNTSNFICINSNIYIHHPSMCITFSKDISQLDNTFIELPYPQGTKRPSNLFFKNFYKQIYSVLPSENIFSDKGTTYLPYSCHIGLNNNIYEAQVLADEITISANPLSHCFCTTHILQKKDVNNLAHPISETSMKLLYLLSSGDLDKLKELSCFFTLLTTAHYKALKKSERKIQIVAGSSQCLNTFIDFLSKCNISSPLIDGLNTVTKKTNLVNINSYPFQGINYISFLPSKKSETVRQQDTILSLIKGNKIQCNNNIGLPVIIKNKLPLVCYSDSSIKTEKITDTYPSQIINLDFEADCISALLSQITSEEIDLIKTFLSLYGLKCISSIFHKSKKKIPNSQDYVSAFISTFYYRENNCYTYFDELYGTYLKYCHKATLVPLSYICFNKVLKKSHEYKRPHTTRSDNRWAYSNLAFNKTAFDEYLNTSQQPENSSKDSFNENVINAQHHLYMLMQNAFSAFDPLKTSHSTIVFNLINNKKENHSV